MAYPAGAESGRETSSLSRKPCVEPDGSWHLENGLNLPASAICSGFGRALKRNCFVCQTNGDIERARIAPVDAIVRSNDSPDDDSTVEPRTVQQRFEHLLDE